MTPAEPERDIAKPERGIHATDEQAEEQVEPHEETDDETQNAG